MSLILDASMALAWIITRTDPDEALLAQETLSKVRQTSAKVPILWYSELANTLLLFERTKRITEQDSVNYLSDLALLRIQPDDLNPAQLQERILDLGRRYNLSSYDANYLELAMRRSASLATFDRKLATAARSAGVQVFGDPQ